MSFSIKVSAFLRQKFSRVAGKRYLRSREINNSLIHIIMTQETNRSPFIRHGCRNIDLCTGRYIQVSNDGSMARWQDSTYIGSLDKYIEQQGRWQEIKYTKDGRPYIMYARRHRKHREYLDNFLRC